MPRNSPRAVSGRQEAEEAGEKKLEQDGEPLESWQRSAGRGTPGGAGDAGSALLRRPPRLATAPPGTAPAPAQLPAPQAHPDHPSERRGRARGAPQNRNREPGVPAGRVRPREDVLRKCLESLDHRQSERRRTAHPGRGKINEGNSDPASSKGGVWGVSVSVRPRPFSPSSPPARPPSHATDQERGSERVRGSPTSTQHPAAALSWGFRLWSSPSRKLGGLGRMGSQA